MGDAVDTDLSYYKNALFKDMNCSNLLEIGPGHGTNMKYFANAGNVAGPVHAVEPNSLFHGPLHIEAKRQGFDTIMISGDTEDIWADDRSFDCVVSTLVLCSAKDIDAALEEIDRVLEPGGSLYFIEHVGAQAPSKRRTAQKLLRGAWREMADGCSLDSDTLPALKRVSGWEVDSSSFVNQGGWVLYDMIHGKARKEKSINQDDGKNENHFDDDLDNSGEWSDFD